MEILKTYDATALHSAGFMDARVLVRAPNEARWLGQRGRLVSAATMRSACSCVARQAPAALNAAPLAALIEWLPMPHCPLLYRPLLSGRHRCGAADQRQGRAVCGEHHQPRASDHGALRARPDGEPGGRHSAAVWSTGQHGAHSAAWRPTAFWTDGLAHHKVACLPILPPQNHCLMAPFDNGKRVLGALFGLDMIVVGSGSTCLWLVLCC